jgi:hypothetical protein
MYIVIDRKLLNSLQDMKTNTAKIGTARLSPSSRVLQFGTVFLALTLPDITGISQLARYLTER